MSRLSFERKKLLRRAAEGLSVAYDDLDTLPANDVLERISEGGDIIVAALAYVTGLEEGVRLEKGNYPTLSAFFAQMATD